MSYDENRISDLIDGGLKEKERFTLMSMVEFVLNEGLNPLQSDVDAWIKSHRYAEFLSKTLELGMFVPVDQNGNILSEPQLIEKRLGFDEVETDYDYAEVEVYKKAKEKIFFDGYNSNGGIAVAKAICRTYQKIEELTNKKIPLVDLILTDNAISQIFGSKEALVKKIKTDKGSTNDEFST